MYPEALAMFSPVRTISRCLRELILLLSPLLQHHPPLGTRDTKLYSYSSLCLREPTVRFFGSSTDSALRPHIYCTYITQHMHYSIQSVTVTSVATMLLRELTKESTESCFQAQLSKDASSSSVDATVDALDMDDC
jgi:hypothetical protein